MNITQSIFTTAAYRVYVAGLFLLPTALVWSAAVSPQSLKMLIAAVALIGALVIAVLGAFKRGSLMVPLSPMLAIVWLLPLVYVVATALAPSMMWSVVGGALDTDTVFFMVLLALSASLPFYIFQSKSDYAGAFMVLLVAAWIVGIYHLVRLFFGADELAFGLFTNPLFSPLGKWNDVSIFFGLVSMLSLITLEVLPLKEWYRYALVGTLIVSLFFVALINFIPVWVVLAIISLGIVLYRFLLAPHQSGKFSIAPTIVFVIAIVLVIFTSSLGSQLGRSLGVEQIEARPSWESTIAVGAQTLSNSPLLGSGPNTFLFEWDKYRPQLINSSVFWNADFTSGIGMVPTSIITTGLLGLLAWVLLFLAFLLIGVRGLLLKAPQDQATYHLAIISFVGALYVLIMAVVYLPSPQIMIVGFAILGMFAALCHSERGGTNLDLNFRERPRIGFVAVLGLALTLVVSVLTVYGVSTVFASSVQFERASIAGQVEGDLAKAKEYLASATQLFPEDRYYRLGVLIHTAEISALLNSTESLPPEAAQAQFQQSLGAAVESGLAAVRLNGTNYRNWQSLSSAYQAVVPLNIDGSYEAAISALARARELNKTMPTLPFAHAQIELVKEKATEARALIEETLVLKQDFTPALLLLAQIELNSGNLKEAIKRAESASVFEPSNPVMQFQVGVLKFENNDLKGAEAAFRNAIQLAPDYSNARYYLGRVLLRYGETDGALKEFTEIARLNPGNQDLQSVVAAIQDGKDPFALPVEEKKK